MFQNQKQVSEMFFPELKSLSYKITTTGNTSKPRHLKQIQDFEPLFSRRELLSFIDLVNCVDFIPPCAQLLASLIDLVSNRKWWRWESDQQEAFVNLKKIPMKLSRPNPSLSHILQTDDSSKCIAAIFYQPYPGGHRIISYGSAYASWTTI